ncbi:hypothetical protein, partial [Plasmodium yoelii yoelii]
MQFYQHLQMCIIFFSFIYSHIQISWVAYNIFKLFFPTFF